MPRILLATLSACIILSAAPGKPLQRIEIQANTPLEITFPGTPGKIIAKDKTGRWKNLDVSQTGGTTSMHFPPGEFANGRALLVLDPPPGVNLDDDKKPRCVEFKVDGKHQKTATNGKATTRVKNPQSFSWIVQDAESALDEDSLRITLDGKPASPKWEKLSPKRLAFRLEAKDFPVGIHSLQIQLADCAIEPNVWRQNIECANYDPTNKILSQPGLKAIRVDSCFSGYSDLAPLTDGVLELPGASAKNDVTWASAETDSSHWVEITFQKKTELQEVSLWWARANVTSRLVEIQIPDGKSWKTIAKLENPPAQVCSTVHFPAVETNQIRIFQPAQKGSKNRPALLWLCEIEAR